VQPLRSEPCQGSNCLRLTDYSWHQTGPVRMLHHLETHNSFCRPALPVPCLFVPSHFESSANNYGDYQGHHPHRNAQRCSSQQPVSCAILCFAGMIMHDRGASGNIMYRIVQLEFGTCLCPPLHLSRAEPCCESPAGQ
jgi:hypothetical protein